jgi:hypothetical protein
VPPSDITATAEKDSTTGPRSAFTARGVVGYDLTVPCMGRLPSWLLRGRQVGGLFFVAAEPGPGSAVGSSSAPGAASCRRQRTVLGLVEVVAGRRLGRRSEARPRPVTSLQQPERLRQSILVRASPRAASSSMISRSPFGCNLRGRQVRGLFYFSSRRSRGPLTHNCLRRLMNISEAFRQSKEALGRAYLRG